MQLPIRDSFPRTSPVVWSSSQLRCKEYCRKFNPYILNLFVVQEHTFIVEPSRLQTGARQKTWWHIKWAWLQEVKASIFLKSVRGKKSPYLFTYVATDLFVLCQSYGDPVTWSFPMQIWVASSIPEPSLFCTKCIVLSCCAAENLISNPVVMRSNYSNFSVFLKICCKPFSIFSNTLNYTTWTHMCGMCI